MNELYKLLIELQSELIDILKHPRACKEYERRKAYIEGKIDGIGLALTAKEGSKDDK